MIVLIFNMHRYIPASAYFDVHPRVTEIIKIIGSTSVSLAIAQ